MDKCLCCGSSALTFSPILWKALIDEWRLASYEVDYINRQQGVICANCGSNLRSMALALAIMRCFGYRGLFQDFVRQQRTQALDILEVNEAGNLSSFLSTVRGHVLKSFPEIDIEALPFGDRSFDLVIHSETLEHVKHPVRALSECHRVLREGGYCAFTVPMVVDRLTASRENMPPSYHGPEEKKTADYLVHTEYGCDSWMQVIGAGFCECRIFSLEYPAAQALAGAR